MVRRASSNAFTLVELLIVIILIAVLASIAIPKFLNSTSKSKEASLKYSLKIVRNAVDRFHADTGVYPNRVSMLDNTIDEMIPTFVGITENNVAISSPGTNYQGPYLSEDGDYVVVSTQPKLPIGTHTGNVKMPVDPISLVAFQYKFVSGKVVVLSSATGNDSNGVPYSSY
jgi:prepilin-type N-terminal cleavage/methylation domain-containing protein